MSFASMTQKFFFHCFQKYRTARVRPESSEGTLNDFCFHVLCFLKTLLPDAIHSLTSAALGGVLHMGREDGRHMAQYYFCVIMN